MIRLSDYFSITRGDAKNLTKKVSSDSHEAVRLLSATADKNGGNKFVIPEEGETVYKNLITINNNGSVGFVFYHPYKFIASSDVTIIQPKDGQLLDTEMALYLKVVIEKQRQSFMYGYKISNDRLKNIQLDIPLLPTGNKIDWEYMRRVISDSHKKMALLPKTSNKLGNSLDLNSKKWKMFNIGGENGILTISSGVRLTKENMNKGNIPFIGATDKNNGITNWVSNKNKSLDNNVLGVNYNGSVVKNFYHPYNAIFSDDVKRIHIKDKSVKASAEMYIFLKCAFLQLEETYQYGFKFNADRMKNQKLLLPMDSKGNPDWNFMESYIKSLPNGDLI